MKYTWKTAKGAEIVAEIEEQHITSDAVNADGNNMAVNCSKWQIKVSSITINGKNYTDCIPAGGYAVDPYVDEYHSTLIYGQVGRYPVGAKISDDVMTAITAGKTAEENRNYEVAKQHENHQNAVKKMMND